MSSTSNMSLCFCLLSYFQKQQLREIKKNKYLNVPIFKKILGEVSLFIVKTWISQIFQLRHHSWRQVHKNMSWDYNKSINRGDTSDFIALKILLSAEIKFWKTPFGISQNHISFKAKCLWWSWNVCTLGSE